MTKTCGNCGHAALDDQAQFCNRCGAAVPEEKKTAFPVCPGCGTVVSDELAQFCNRCGTRMITVPAVCSKCGSPAIDSQSRFCTRCGTTFQQKKILRNNTCPSCGAPDPDGQSLFCNRCGAAYSRREAHTAYPLDHAPVIVTQRKPAHPSLTGIPDTDWEPWNDEPAVPAFSPSHGSVLPNPRPLNEQQISLPQKRYAHLPLVADEMRKKNDTGSAQRPPETPTTSQKRKTGSQKKGVLGFLKK